MHLEDVGLVMKALVECSQLVGDRYRDAAPLPASPRKTLVRGTVCVQVHGAAASPASACIRGQHAA